MGALDPITGVLGSQRVAHLLRRLTFGPNQTQINTFAAYTITDALKALFDGFTIPGAPVKPDASEWVLVPPVEDEKDFELFNYFKYWWLGLMYQSNTAQEKLVFLLHTIITTKVETGGSARDIYFQNALFRQYITNDFTDTNANFNRYPQLLKKVCIDNSMLSFLDGRVNVKGRPNENFARELFELFTLGKGPTIGVGNYTTYSETDIKEAAKALTGWDQDSSYQTIDTDTALPRGKVKGNSQNASAHDNTIKTFTSALSSSTYPNPSITPNASLLNGSVPTEASCYDEVSQLINLIYAKPEASQYLVRRIYRFYIHQNITSEIETDVIVPVANAFIDSGFRLRVLLETLFQSTHFFEAGATIADDKHGCLIKSPFDVVFGTLRYFGVAMPASGTADFNTKMGQIENYVKEMGLSFLDPYDVAGYEPYYQAPAYNRNWITTNTLLRRYAFIEDLFQQRTEGLAYVDPIDWFNDSANGITDTLATTPTVVNSQNLGLGLLQHVASRLLVYATKGTQISDERYNYFAIYHLGGLPFENWVTYWGQRNTTDAALKEDARAPMRNILYVLMQSPEYQLM